MFQKGQSGNPKGRAPGSGMQTKLKAAVGEQFDDLVKVVVDAALSGDMQAATILMARLVPTVRPTQEPTPFTLTGNSLTERAQSLLTATAEGKLSVGDAKTLLDALAAVAKIEQMDELAARLSRLEELANGHRT